MKLAFAIDSLILLAIIPKNDAEEFNLNFHQNDYQLYFERVEIIRYNKEFIKNIHIKTFKYNRTLAVVNATVIPNADLESLEAIVDVYKFLSNEYRSFGVHFQINTCKAYKANLGGVQTVNARCGNIYDCGLKKGIKYYICNAYPDQTKLPPYVPNGQYKAEVQVLRFSQEVMFGSGYATVSRPFV